MKRHQKKALVYNDTERGSQVSDTASPTQYTDRTQGPGIGNISGDFYAVDPRDNRYNIEKWIRAFPRLRKLIKIVKSPYVGRG